MAYLWGQNNTINTTLDEKLTETEIQGGIKDIFSKCTFPNNSQSTWIFFVKIRYSEVFNGAKFDYQFKASL